MATTGARTESKDELLKEAAAMLDVAARREEAEKLAFAMVEKGRIPPFADWATFQEKVASLLGMDLRVVEAALDLDVDAPSFGKVAGESVSQDPTDAFYHRLTDD